MKPTMHALPNEASEKESRKHHPAGQRAASQAPQVAAAVHRALRSTGYLPLRSLQVSVIGDEIVLRGKVPTYFMFQMAQTMVMGMALEKKLRNELEVTCWH